LRTKIIISFGNPKTIDSCGLSESQLYIGIQGKYEEYNYLYRLQ